MRQIVGFSQRIKRAWLDAVLDRMVITTDKSELREFLDDQLKEELPGKESRAKSVGIISQIWISIPPERVLLRDRAVALLPRISGQERIWLHWGMAALAYPFFRDTAGVIGRLLSLQDDFTTAQVQSRMLTNWGDRVTSKEALQKLVTSLLEWEVLRSTKTKGHFLLARKMAASIPDLQLWLVETLLGASAAAEIEAQHLLRLPESFPFTISIGIADLRQQDRFDIHRQGLDMDMIALRKLRVSAVTKPAKRPVRLIEARSKSVPSPIAPPSLNDKAERKNSKSRKRNQPSLFETPVEFASADVASMFRDQISEAVRRIRECTDLIDAERILATVISNILKSSTKPEMISLGEAAQHEMKSLESTMLAHRQGEAPAEPLSRCEPRDCSSAGASPASPSQDSAPMPESAGSLEDAKRTHSETKTALATTSVSASGITMPELAGLKALSVRQPHAEAIMRGIKTTDDRSTATKFRGRILIYAPLGRDHAPAEAEMMNQYCIDDVAINDLPRGVLIGTAELHDCDGHKWHLRNPKRLETPVKPIKQPKPVWFNPF